MGRLYGSLQNRLQERTKQSIKPEVGMGATELCYSDRYPYEITQVLDDRHIMVRKMDYKRTDNNGMGESQEYEYTSNTEWGEIQLFLTKKGVWKQRVGKHGEGNTFIIGTMERYYDFTF